MPIITSIGRSGVASRFSIVPCSSSRATDIAVSATMVIDSLMAFFVIWRFWKWPLWKAALLMLPLALIEQAFFAAKHTGGKPDTPSCTSCHSQDPTAAGETRAGKRIEPMAVSKNPSRFTKVDEVNKWFGRNCNSVLGRECTAVEKGDFITYLSGK